MFFALPLAIPPAYIGIVARAERRWGPSWSGRLTAVPTQTSTVVLIVGLTTGLATAAGVAAGALLGVISLSIFAATYGAVATRRPWWVALAASLAAFFAAAALLDRWNGGPLVDAAAAIATIAGVLVFLTRRRMPASHRPVRHFSILGRMVVATVLVAAVALVVPWVGPLGAGTLGVFPIITGPMTVFNHAESGPDAARRYLAGLEWGLPGGVAWFLVLSLDLERLGLAEGFLVALPVLVGVLLVAFLLPARWGRRAPEGTEDVARAE